MSELGKKNGKLQLVEALQEFALAGATAAESAAKSCSDTVFEFFEKDGKPKMVSMNLNGREVEIPLIVLVNPPSLRLSKTDMDFAVSVNIDADGICMHNHLNLLQRGIKVTIRMEFEGTDRPEGLELIREKLNRDLSDLLK